ncbi:MAG: hypothetical protein HYR72_05510 [Deltaproteobacteria bacterium]|nr:hypothetical protein [Deltaproteobacteria bacterium]MBI3389653.1 hypothetical protein [Deltaproteobacteria bacterium]
MESYEKFNYAVRPNKRTQRKMIFEALARYVSVFPKRRFSYVGFGSMWFSDFLYAHRRLGVKTLTSVERTEGYRRAVFNRPFKCVRVVEGNSSEVLPSLSWKDASIVWLDYDYVPESESLQDIALLASKLASGSVLIVTYDARPPWKDGDKAKAREAALRRVFGDAVPFTSKKRTGAKTQKPGPGLTHQSEYMPTLVSLLWTHLKNLLVQNGRAVSEKPTWAPLFSFHYRDGAPMVTIGAALLNPHDALHVHEGELSSHLPYLRGEALFRIAIPPLTQKERTELDRRLPSRNVNLPFPLAQEQIESYADLYRYYPLFAEVEL